MTSTDAGGSGIRCAVPTRTDTFVSLRVRRAASVARSGCGSTPYTRRACEAQRGRWKPVPQPRSRTSRPDHPTPPRTSRMADSMTPSGSTERFSSSYVSGWCQMLGLGTAPSRGRMRAGPGSDPDDAVRGPELHRNHARRTVGGHPVDEDVLERTLHAVPEPVRDPRRVPGDLQRLEVHPAGAAGARVVLGQALPLHEERQLRVRLHPQHADLAPPQLDAVGPVPVALDGVASETRLDLAHVLDGHDPPEPAAAHTGPSPHRLAEGGLVRCRVVEDLDDLDVGSLGERQDHVAGSETRVDAAVVEVLAEQGADAVGSPPEPFGPGCVRDMVQAHTQHSHHFSGSRAHRGGLARLLC